MGGAQPQRQLTDGMVWINLMSFEVHYCIRCASTILKVVTGTCTFMYRCD